MPYLSRVALVVTAVASLGGAALAQTSPLSPSPTMSPPAATRPVTPSLGTAPPAEPTPAAVALAREVIVASGISRSFDIVVPQFLDQIGTNLTRTRPDLIRDLNTVMEQIKPEFDKQTQDLIGTSARLYAQRLTEKQLKDIVDFFKSPSGAAYVTTQPLVMTDLFAQMQQFQQRIAPEMMTRVRTEMKKRGHEL